MTLTADQLRNQNVCIPLTLGRRAADELDVIDALRITDPETGELMSHERAWKMVATVFDDLINVGVGANYRDFLRGIR